MKSSHQPPSFATLVRDFFCERLLNQQNVSPHTVTSYRDAFRLLLAFLKKRKRRPPAELLLQHVDVTLIALWLGHESSETTHLYVEADLEMKRRVLERIEEPQNTNRRRKKADKLLDFLDRL
jgi:site-specific recombinase XerD